MAFEQPFKEIFDVEENCDMSTQVGWAVFLIHFCNSGCYSENGLRCGTKQRVLYGKVPALPS